MKLLPLFFCFICLSCVAESKRTLIFSDDFERQESNNKYEELGNGWTTNSKRRAKGNKQVDLKNGALYISRHKVADHGVSVVHDANFKNGEVWMKFKLEQKGDSFKVNFADLKYKKVHAGHLFAVAVKQKTLSIEDLKTGKMDKQIRDLKKAGQLSKLQKQKVKSKIKIVKHQFTLGQWYELLIRIEGDTLSTFINAEPILAWSSEGIAHPTKRNLRLGVEKNAVVDDIKVFSIQ